MLNFIKFNYTKVRQSESYITLIIKELKLYLQTQQLTDYQLFTYDQLLIIYRFKIINGTQKKSLSTIQKS